MKAVNLEKPFEIAIKEIPDAAPKAGEALIRVRAVGICGSDIGAYRGTNPLVSYPRIIGHEVVGEVLSIPENKRGIKAGDRVVVDPYLFCGHCYPCSIGRTNCCEDLHVLGVHVDGGMSETMTHPADMLVPLPDGLSWELAVMAEPLTIALHAIHRTKLSKGEHFVINGAGAIGMLAALAAIDYGAIPILVDPLQARLDHAGTLGVKHLINLSKVDAIEEIRKITNGRMAEVVMEASGASAAIRNTLDMVSYAGRIAFTGWPKGETSLPTTLITKKELDLRGSRVSVGEFDEALELIASGRVNVMGVVSKMVTLDEVPEMVRELSDHPEQYLKINALVD